MTSFLNRRFAVPLIIAGLILILGSSHDTLQAKSAAGSVQKEFIELNRKISPSVVAVNIGIYTWSGFFISEDGLVLTTSDILEQKPMRLPMKAGHPSVVPGKKDPSKVLPSIMLASGKTYTARILGQDFYNNVVLLKVDSKDRFTPVDLGSSNNITIGRFVATVGNVYASINNDNQSSYSVGAVTGFFRLTGTRDYKGYVVETDASVNPGGEGGPIVGLDGKVVAMACKHYALSRFQGTGIPIDQIKLVLEDLKLGRKIYSGYFGATFEDTYIERVDSPSPAQAAGLQRGDKIVEIDGVFVNSDDNIRVMLGNAPGGTKANIFVQRDGKEILLTVTFSKGIAGKEISLPPLPGGPKPWAKEKGRPFLGLTLQEQAGRLAITEIAAGSPAAKAGLTPGLALVELNGEKVASLASFEVKFAKLRPGQTISIRLRRKDGFEKTFTITLAGKVGKSF